MFLWSENLATDQLINYFQFADFFLLTSYKLTFSNIWSILYFFVNFHVLLTFSISLYSFSCSPVTSSRHAFKNHNSYVHISFKSLIKFLYTPIIVLVFLIFTWTSPIVTSWFGHIVFSHFQYSITFSILFSFFVTWYVYLTSFVFNSKDVYDYIIGVYNFLIWTIVLFYANNTFTIIFVIETLSILTTLVLITSPISSLYFSNPKDLHSTLYFSSLTPHTFLNTLIFFFWMSLVSSLLLFIFLIFFYTRFLTFDFVLVESILCYIVTVSTVKDILLILLSTFIFILVVFFKSGVVPLYVWKPVFFKGMPLHVLFFYICFFYYFLLLFFIYFLVVYLNDLTYYNSVLLILLSLIGTLFLIIILVESYYLKSFLAMSSILNTLLIFLAVGSISTCTFFINM